MKESRCAPASPQPMAELSPWPENPLTAAEDVLQGSHAESRDPRRAERSTLNGEWRERASRFTMRIDTVPACTRVARDMRDDAGGDP
jgi:hypothetical protein